MDRHLVNTLIDKAYKIAEKECDGNGYVSHHKVVIDEHGNTTKFTVLNNDNQGEEWIDEYDYTSNGKGVEYFQSYKMDYNVQLDKLSLLDGLKDFINYLFKSIFQTKGEQTPLANKLISEYLDKDFIQSEIDKAIECSNNAYDRYMYEECAETGYDAEASRQAFSEHVKYKLYVDTLTKLEDELQSRNQE